MWFSPFSLLTTSKVLFISQTVSRCLSPRARHSPITLGDSSSCSSWWTLTILGLCSLAVNLGSVLWQWQPSFWQGICWSSLLPGSPGLCCSKWSHPGCLLEMPNLRPRPRPAQSELTGVLKHEKHWSSRHLKITHVCHFVPRSAFPLSHCACQTWRWSPGLSETQRNPAALKRMVFVVRIMFSLHFSDLQLTGIILRAAKRFQVNVYVQKIDGFM